MSNQREQQEVAANGDAYRYVTRLKKNRSFQLGKLTDKGKSVQLLKPEHALSQLQSVFDGVQMALRGKALMEYGTQASLLQAHATEQQRILRSTRVDINVVLETVQGTQNPSHNLLHPARDIQSRADSHLKCNLP